MMQSLLRLLQLLRPFLGKLIIAVILSLCTCLGLLIIPYAVRMLLGAVINGTAMTYSPLPWIGIGLGVILIAVSGYSVFIIMYDVAYQVTARLRSQFVDHLLHATMQFHYDTSAGGIIDRLLTSLSDIEGFITFSLVSMISITVILSGGLAMIVVLSWKLSLLMLVTITVVSLGLRYILIRVRQSLKESEAASSRLVSHIHELLLNIAIVKAFNAYKVELQRFQQHQSEMLSHQHKEARFAALTEPLVTVIAITTVLLVLMVGTWQVFRHEIQIETLIGFLLYVGLLLPQARAISNFYLGIQYVHTAFARLDAIFTLPLEHNILGATDLPKDIEGAIEFHHVTFWYQHREIALDDLSLSIGAKECVGIVGASGAGKSTVCSLLLRLDTPQKGTISIDGIDIRKVTAKSLRNVIAIVPQDIVLFDDAILNNVRYGKPDATDEEVQAACRSAHADEFIESLPHQYQTIVGERGLKLSGGQRQRIAIARALLKNTPILLLDEATSSLDAHGEYQLRSTMEHAMQGRTTIVIAHRLATVIYLPRIIVLHQGRIVDDGTHTELFGRSQHYRNLVSSQLISTEFQRAYAAQYAGN
ncbi:MAG: ABC transporter ATP-binding protein [Ignavibacteriae bacterium]|nr:ABC transporter ATP-binding protein [Ignavibacteriota bacterium]